MNYHYLHFDEIDSTNNYLKNSYSLLGNFTIVSADYQNKGKGRKDRVWESNQGQNLMFSVLIKDFNLIKISPVLSLITSVVIAKFLEDAGIKNVTIKWPNDVLINDKKICGILLEGQLPNYLVIGVGLNVNQKEFPNGLRRPATSMANELNKDINLELLKEELFPKLVNSLSNINKTEFLQYYKNHNYLQNKRVRVFVNDEPFIGEVIGVDDNFFLQIKTSDMLLHIDSGEIEIL